MGDWAMTQHRFRTAVLIGEWRETREQACADALRTQQARIDERIAGQLVWRVPGEIETDCTRV